ncbi:MAG: hypothetical protein OHK0015_29880 [Chloroflexi bacterium OHK40]
MIEALNDILTWLLIAMAIALTIAALGLALMWRSIKRLRVPREAGYFATMHYVPLGLVILLDLLDFGLDIFAAPVSWLLLDRLGLRGLRNKAAIEALIPFTQPIPTFTLSWFAARYLGVGDDMVPRVIEGEAREARPQLPPH